MNDFLADHFPEIKHPAYQTAAEKITFVTVTAMMVGLLVAGIAMLLFAA